MGLDAYICANCNKAFRGYPEYFRGEGLVGREAWSGVCKYCAAILRLQNKSLVKRTSWIKENVAYK